MDIHSWNVIYDCHSTAASDKRANDSSMKKLILLLLTGCALASCAIGVYVDLGGSPVIVGDFAPGEAFVTRWRITRAFRKQGITRILRLQSLGNSVYNADVQTGGEVLHVTVCGSILSD